MGYELDWDPVKNEWRVWSTITCSFIGTAKTPEEVADIVTEGKEFYYCDIPEISPDRPVICTYHPGLTIRGRPDPKAKAEVRQAWIEEAAKAREEKRRVSLVCEVTPEGEMRRILPE
ncbi:MAG: hypothetical protein JRD89_20365 [Deltaproteobacteria bacterium]|nr:hypothetical protein [Deltaproteobacteria bacterium]